MCFPPSNSKNYPSSSLVHPDKCPHPLEIPCPNPRILCPVYGITTMTMILYMYSPEDPKKGKLLVGLI